MRPEISPGRAVLLAIGDEEILERQGARRRSSRSSSSAPSAINAGGMSPIGEPLAMLPPTVPEARTCFEPRRRSSLAEIGIDAGEMRRGFGIGGGAPIASSVAIVFDRIERPPAAER